MLEFFVALFGGIHYTSKALAERSEMKRVLQYNECIREAWKTRLHLWESLVIDRELQEDLLNIISGDREAAWREVRDTCQHMRHKKSYASATEWAHDGALDRTKEGKRQYRHHRYEEPLDLMLAKHGKVRSEIASSTVAFLRRGDGQNTREEWDRTVELWVFIRDELRRHGVDAVLLFERGVSTNDYFNVDDVDKFRYQHGRLVWLPSTWLNADLTPL